MKSRLVHFSVSMFNRAARRAKNKLSGMLSTRRKNARPHRNRMSAGNPRSGPSMSITFCQDPPRSPEAGLGPRFASNRFRTNRYCKTFLANRTRHRSGQQTDALQINFGVEPHRRAGIRSAAGAARRRKTHRPPRGRTKIGVGQLSIGPLSYPQASSAGLVALSRRHRPQTPIECPIQRRTNVTGGLFVSSGSNSRRANKLQKFSVRESQPSSFSVALERSLAATQGFSPSAKHARVAKDTPPTPRDNDSTGPKRSKSIFRIPFPMFINLANPIIRNGPSLAQRDANARSSEESPPLPSFQNGIK